MAEKDPEEKLDEMYRMMKELDVSPLLSDIRNPPKPKQMRGKVLQILFEHGWLTADEVTKKFNEVHEDEYIRRQVTGTMSDLYGQYFLNREGGYEGEYYLSPIGVQVVREWDEDATSLSDFTGVEDEQEDKADPWEDTELSEGQYHALLAVDEAGDKRCTQKEADEIFLNRTDYADPDEGDAISVRLHRLKEKKEKQYVDCAPGTPRIWWLTEAGEELIND